MKRKGLILALFLSWGCRESLHEEKQTLPFFELPSPQAFFNAPFPNDVRRHPDGTLDLSLFPNPRRIGFLQGVVDLAGDVLTGFSNTPAIYFRFTSPLDVAGLPASENTIAPSSPVFLVDVEPGSSEFGRRIPVTIAFRREEGDYFSSNTLVLQPVFGFVLRGGVRYAAVVMTSVHDARGRAIGSSSLLQKILRGGDPSLKTLAEIYRPLSEYLNTYRIPASGVSTATVFTPQDPMKELRAIRDWLPSHMSDPLITGWTYIAALSAYDWYEGWYQAPSFQYGSIPYAETGGQFSFTVSGEPVIQRMESLRFTLVVPHGSQPSGGWPLVLVAHGTGGNYRTFIYDQSAYWMASSGLAAIGIDQPLHGARKEGLSFDEGIYFFNIFNPQAGRTNPRQAAVDDFVLTRLCRTTLAVPATVSTTGQTISFNAGRLLFLGHSQGGITGTLFLALEPLVLGGVLSGDGGGVSLSMLYKEGVKEMVEVFARSVLGISHTLTTDNPVFTLVQSLSDVSDPLNYAPALFHRPPPGNPPRSIFMTEGFLDIYTPPPTAEALALAGWFPQIAPAGRIIPWMDLLGLSPQAPPVGMNVSSPDGMKATAGLVQYPNDDHFAIYFDPAAIAQYTSFLNGLGYTGSAQIVPP